MSLDEANRELVLARCTDEVWKWVQDYNKEPRLYCNGLMPADIAGRVGQHLQGIDPKFLSPERCSGDAEQRSGICVCKT